MNVQQTDNLLGTEAAPVTLTATFAGNVSGAKSAIYMRRIAFDVTYLPAVNNAYAQLSFEYSNESINSTNLTKWKPFAAVVTSTTEVDIYAQKGTNMGTNSGTPINIPAPNTSTASQSVTSHVEPDTDIVANWIRVRAQEVTTGAFGTLFLSVSMQS